MKQLHVDLGRRSYPIYIGSGLLSKKELIAPHIKGTEALIVTNETVAPLYLECLEATLGSLKKLHRLILPDGEKYKTLDTMGTIYDALMSQRHSRETTLIALGGGVVGDITGFAAATYQRGVNFIQIPTTLLSQVDSSVGGKTGVNHSLGKNMIGAFYQPIAVVADIDTLDTLPNRQYRAGLAEVVKYGLIADRDFYYWLRDRVAAINARDPLVLMDMIERSCGNKAKVVARDEREANIRAILNLGHTFGHAIETLEQYRGLLHGEAVAVGMAMALDLSRRLGWLDESVVEEAISFLQALGLPVTVPSGIGADDLLETMAMDKKVSANTIRLVLLKSIGEAVVTADFPQNALVETLKAYC